MAIHVLNFLTRFRFLRLKPFGLERGRRERIRAHPSPLGRRASPGGKGMANRPEPLDEDGDLRAPFGNSVISRSYSAFYRPANYVDFTISETLENRTCVIQYPITLPGWYQIASSSNLLAATHREWSFG